MARIRTHQIGWSPFRFPGAKAHAKKVAESVDKDVAYLASLTSDSSATAAGQTVPALGRHSAESVSEQAAEAARQAIAHLSARLKGMPESERPAIVHEFAERAAVPSRRPEVGDPAVERFVANAYGKEEPAFTVLSAYSEGERREPQDVLSDLVERVAAGEPEARAIILAMVRVTEKAERRLREESRASV